jgi:hypothetical protein
MKPVGTANGQIGGFFVASAEYHRKQAQVLIQLAQSTRDPETAAALMRLAAEHTALADKAARKEKRSNGGSHRT